MFDPAQFVEGNWKVEKLKDDMNNELRGRIQIRILILIISFLFKRTTLKAKENTNEYRNRNNTTSTLQMETLSRVALIINLIITSVEFMARRDPRH